MSDDNITLFALTACGAASMPEGNVMLHVEYITGPTHAIEDALSLRLSITNEQAQTLARVVQKTAQDARRRRHERHDSTH